MSGVTVDAKCPKCGSKTFFMQDMIMTSDDYLIEDGKPIYRHAGNPNFEDHGFRGSCDCGHKWHMRYSTAQKIYDAFDEKEANETT